MKTQFEKELEYVQLLCNPNFLLHLKSEGYFENPKFIEFLKYLRYWNNPPYYYFLIYPECTIILDMILDGFEINDENMKILDEQLKNQWKNRE